MSATGFGLVLLVAVTTLGVLALVRRSRGVAALAALAFSVLVGYALFLIFAATMMG